MALAVASSWVRCSTRSARAPMSEADDPGARGLGAAGVWAHCGAPGAPAAPGVGGTAPGGARPSAASTRSRCAACSWRIEAKPSMARRMEGVTLYQSFTPRARSRMFTTSSTRVVRVAMTNRGTNAGRSNVKFRRATGKTALASAETPRARSRARYTNEPDRREGAPRVTRAERCARARASASSPITATIGIEPWFA